MTGQMTAADRKVIKSMMQQDGWASVMKFIALKLEQWRKIPTTGTTAFEELRAVHKRDGMIEGVEEIIDQLERQAFE